MSSPPRLPRKPEARTQKVEELVDRVLRGQVRVPRFQRGLKWQSKDVVALFDSLYRGYPIGSLLFYREPAKAQRLTVGPLLVDAPEMPGGAWWVIDGQQRVTSLAAGLARALPIPKKPSRDDPFALYFDAAKQKFEPPSTSGRIPSTWVALPHLLDASKLTEWVFGWQHGTDERLRRRIFEAGTRLREYSIPLYLIETEDPEVAKEIFYRTNNAGKRLKWEEVHDALFGSAGPSPSTLQELSEELMRIGMGRLEENRLLTCLLAFHGQDPTQSLPEHYRRDPNVLRTSVLKALPALRGVLSFLRQDAGVPHLRLLPKTILLDVLTRFFALHEDPRARTRTLLARWFWRAALGGGAFEDRTLRRRSIAAIGDDEETSVQTLLGLIRVEPQRPFELPASFDARADGSRVALLALAHLEPRDFESGRPLDVAALLEENDKDSFVKIVKRAKASRSPANRTLYRLESPLDRLLLDRIASTSVDDPVLASHAIDPRAAECLVAGDVDGFLAIRAELLTEETRRFAARMAAWEHNDRPSIDYLLKEAGVEA